MNNRKSLFVLLVLLITFVSFLPVLKADFTNWDDEGHIFLNPDVLVLDPAHVSRIFSATVNRTYIPLTTLSFAVEHHFFGFEPFVFHLDNLLLHLGVTLLVILIGLQMGLAWEAVVLAALLFGIHPMRVESVAWLTERKDVLYAFFYLLSLYCYGEFALKNHAKPYLLSVLFAGLSILAKPMAVSLPLILLLYDWWLRRKFSWKTAVEKIPHGLVMLLFGLVTYVLYARVPQTQPLEAVLIWTWSLAFYILKFLFPLSLSPVYAKPLPVAWTNPVYLASVVFVCVLLVLLWRNRRQRLWMFAFLYFFLSVFFLLRFDHQDLHAVADRFMYLPSLGMCLLAGVLIHRGFLRLMKQGNFLRRAGITAIAGLFLFLSVKTGLQSYIWQNGFRLWSAAIRENPELVFAYYNRAKMYEYYGEIDAALEDYSRAIGVKCDFADAFHNRGNLYYLKGKNQLAEADFLTALELNPQLWTAYGNLGSLYYGLGKFEQSIFHYSKALRLRPDSFFTYANRGLAYQFHGDWDLALADFNKALEINPEAVPALANRGNLYTEMAEYGPAIADYTEALRLDPNLKILYFNRAKAYEAKGDYAGALADARRIEAALVPEIEEYRTRLNQLLTGISD